MAELNDGAPWVPLLLCVATSDVHQAAKDSFAKDSWVECGIVEHENLVKDKKLSER